jgi:hypothetical protein
MSEIQSNPQYDELIRSLRRLKAMTLFNSIFLAAVLLGGLFLYWRPGKDRVSHVDAKQVDREQPTAVDMDQWTRKQEKGLRKRMDELQQQWKHNLKENRYWAPVVPLAYNNG